MGGLLNLSPTRVRSRNPVKSKTKALPLYGSGGNANHGYAVAINDRPTMEDAVVIQENIGNTADVLLDHDGILHGWSVIDGQCISMLGIASRRPQH